MTSSQDPPTMPGAYDQPVESPTGKPQVINAQGDTITLSPQLFISSGEEQAAPAHGSDDAQSHQDSIPIDFGAAKPHSSVGLKAYSPEEIHRVGATVDSQAHQEGTEHSPFQDHSGLRYGRPNRPRRRPPRRRRPRKNVEPETKLQSPSVTDQFQLLMMSQMMNQQMAAQQMQVAQMGALAQNQRPHIDAPAPRGNGRTSIQVRNYNRNQAVKGRAPARRMSRRSLPMAAAPMRITPPQSLPPIDSSALDNWQEITVILVIAMVGLIYLVCSRSPAPEEKKPSTAAKHLT